MNHLRMCANNCNRFPLHYASAYTPGAEESRTICMGEKYADEDAVVLRLQNICKERNIRYNELATRSGVTPVNRL